MTSITEIMQLCRLCLVKEQVNIPIFEEQGDLQQIIEKISACLPVKVSKEDKLPKKICDGCSYKLELLYQFRNTTVTAEKQLLSWINQLGGNKVENEVKSQPATHHIVKEEVDIVDTTDHPDTEYLLGQQITFEGGDTPFLESQDDNGAGDDDITNSSDDEPLAKRRKRLLEDKGQISAGESKEEVVQHMAVTKTEDASESEGEENVDDPEPNFVSVGTDDIQQPGPSGVGKAATTDIPNSEKMETINLERNPLKESAVLLKDTKDVDITDLSGHHEININLDVSNADSDFEDSPELVIINENIPLNEKDTTDSEQSTSFKCAECNKEFLVIDQYRLHLKIHKFSSNINLNTSNTLEDSKHGPDSNEAKPDTDVEISNSSDEKEASTSTNKQYSTFKCTECNKDFLNIHQYRLHLRMHKFTSQKNNAKSCKQCDKTYKCERAYIKHIQSYHLRSSPVDTAETTVDQIEIVCNDIDFDMDEYTEERTKAENEAVSRSDADDISQTPQDSNADDASKVSLPSNQPEPDIVEIVDSDDESENSNKSSDKNNESSPKILIPAHKTVFILVRTAEKKICSKCKTAVEKLNLNGECDACNNANDSFEGNLVIDDKPNNEDNIEIVDLSDDDEEELPTVASVSPFSVSVTCVTCKSKFQPSNSVVMDGKVLCKGCAEKKLTCNFCNQRTRSLQNLHIHMKQVHHCLICSKHFTNLLKHRSRQVTCTICGCILCKKTVVQKHYQVKHEKYYCTICGVIYDSDYALYMHSRTLHNT